MTQPLMPKATAVWLIDNTALTFKQVADFCGLHELEVKGIADGDVAAGIKGNDPIASGQLTRTELEKSQADNNRPLILQERRSDTPDPARRKGPRYTPVSRRQDRPDAISWLVRNHPELSDAQISKLVGTTKPTIQAIRDRTHWNSSNIKPQDPVGLGLCSQIELDETVKKAAAKKARQEAKEGGTGLKPTAESLEETSQNSNLITAAQMEESLAAAENASEFLGESHSIKKEEKEDYLDPDKVFANLKSNKD